MFFKTSRPPNGIDSLIGAGTRIEGDVFFSGALRLDGTVRGNVSAVPEQRATLVVGTEARIEGEVRAPHVVVMGAIEGQLMGSETLELQPSARIIGDVHYRSIEIQRGAVVDGRLVHTGDAALKPMGLKLASRV